MRDVFRQTERAEKYIIKLRKKLNDESLTGPIRDERLEEIKQHKQAMEFVFSFTQDIKAGRFIGKRDRLDPDERTIIAWNRGELWDQAMLACRDQSRGQHPESPPLRADGWLHRFRR